MCLAGHCVRGGGWGREVCQLQGEALWVLTGGGKGGAKRERQSIGITTDEGSSRESDEAKGEERESCEGGHSEWPLVR